MRSLGRATFNTHRARRGKVMPSSRKFFMLAIVFASPLLNAQLHAAQSSSGASSDDEVIVYDPPKLLIEEPGVKCEGPSFKASPPPEGAKPHFPTLRCTPQFPEKCSADGKKVGKVEYLSDVNSQGQPYNVRVVRATHECLAPSGAISVAGARFSESEDGILDTETVITFLFPD